MKKILAILLVMVMTLTALVLPSSAETLTPDLVVSVIVETLLTNSNLNSDYTIISGWSSEVSAPIIATTSETNTIILSKTDGNWYCLQYKNEALFCAAYLAMIYSSVEALGAYVNGIGYMWDGEVLSYSQIKTFYELAEEIAGAA